MRAPAGPGRDAWLAAYRAAATGPVVRLPLHVDDDRLLGGTDLAATIAAGRPVTTRGLLAEAAGGTVIVAMAERIAPALAGRLAAAADAGLRLVLLDEGEDDEGGGGDARRPLRPVADPAACRAAGDACPRRRRSGRRLLPLPTRRPRCAPPRPPLVSIRRARRSSRCGPPAPAPPRPDAPPLARPTSPSPPVWCSGPGQRGCRHRAARARTADGAGKRIERRQGRRRRNGGARRPGARGDGDRPAARAARRPRRRTAAAGAGERRRRGAARAAAAGRCPAGPGRCGAARGWRWSTRCVPRRRGRGCGGRPARRA